MDESLYIDFASEAIALFIVLIIYLILNETYFKKRNPRYIVRLGIQIVVFYAMLAVVNLIEIAFGTHEPIMWLIDLAIVLGFAALDALYYWLTHRNSK